MKVGIIGSGGREHAICLALNSSDKVNQIYCFPGNAGTAEIAENISPYHLLEASLVQLQLNQIYLIL